MRELLQERQKSELVKVTASATNTLWRKCACGGSTGASGECNDCRTNWLLEKRAPMAVNSSGEPSETEAHADSEFKKLSMPIRRRAEGSGMTRLRLSKPGDACEIEADAVAEKVVSNLGMSAPAQVSAGIPSSTLHCQTDADAGATQDTDNAESGSDNGSSFEIDGDAGADDITQDDEVACDDSGCPKMESNASPAPREAPVSIPRHGGRALQRPVRTLMESILVERAAHQATATWSDNSVTLYECSPSTKSGKGGKMPKPTGDFNIGIKCDSCHTNRKGDEMGWFTGIVGRRIGFHNSQLVGPTHESHGCIRVSCFNAKEIHDNTKSSSTTVKVKA